MSPEFDRLMHRAPQPRDFLNREVIEEQLLSARCKFDGFGENRRLEAQDRANKRFRRLGWLGFSDHRFLLGL